MAIFSPDSSSRPGWVEPYRPLWTNGDLQTILGRYWPVRLDESRWLGEAAFIETGPGVQVLAKTNRGGGRATLLAVHGLTACSEARYMLTFARIALAAGFDAVRLNVRNCGGTEALAPTLYHSGLTSDLRHVAERLGPQPLFIVGFSMGGNMALKLAGEWGERPPSHLRGVCGISVPADLAACARRIGERRNRVYELRFLRSLRRTLARKRQLMPEMFNGFDADGLDSIYEFDDKVTAPSFGFASADDYYSRASSAGYLAHIRVPALAIQAEDDPFIPFSAYRNSAFERNPWLQLLHTRHGGHVAFLAKERARFWAERQALRFFENLLEKPG